MAGRMSTSVCSTSTAKAILRDRSPRPRTAPCARPLFLKAPANGRLALLRFGSQSILSLLTEDADANREVVCRWSRHHSYFLYFSMHFGERAAVRAEALFRDALALHWAVSRRPHCCHLRGAAPTQRVLHGGRQRRCLEDHRFRKHLESDFRRPANWLRRRACRCSVRSEHHLRR